MKNRKSILFFFFLLISCMGCKCKEAISPEDKLPPATQSGANTFGFLLNREVWLPNRAFGSKNISWYYDTEFAGGDLNVSAYRYLSDLDKQSIAVGMVNLKTIGNYTISNESDAAIRFFSLKDSCELSSLDSLTYCAGELAITRLDTLNGVISGTFWATLYDPSCKDTIKITEGRFDLSGN